MKNLPIIFYFISLFLLGCQPPKKEKIEQTYPTTITYAKGFRIQKNNYKTTITLINPLRKEKNITYTISNQKNAYHIPPTITRVIATSTTQIPLFEALGKENTLVGFTNTKLISSAKIISLIKNKTIQNVGSELAINTEKTISLQPNIVFASISNQEDKAFEVFKKLNIPVFIDASWLEETPLGRAEWIKVFGVILNKEKEADSIFKIIEKNYLHYKKLAKTDKHRPTVFCGNTFQGIWYCPAGNSYMAQFFKDANTQYVFNHSQGKGSLTLNFEQIYKHAKNADYWIDPGAVKTKKDLQNNYQYGSMLTAVRKNQVYTMAHQTGPNGGLLFYELGALRVDYILKDYIKITHPQISSGISFTFFNKIE